VREYLYDVVTRLEAGCPLQDLHSLVPDVWLANKTAEKRADEPVAAAASVSH
jgi:hypothetical protein